MVDSFSETTSESWFSRLGHAIGGVLIGLVLFLAAFPLLWWNEGRAIKTARSLQEGARTVISIAADRLDPSNEGKLVHATGQATTAETLTDPEFHVAAGVIKLIRHVEMYQWREDKRSETRTKIGGGQETTTTYKYQTVWTAKAIDSSAFRESSGHENPGAPPWESKTMTADRVTLGAFTLSPDLVAKIDHRDDLRVETTEGSPDADLQVVAGGFYKGSNPASPRVGDVRVRFEVVRPLTVSVVALERGANFEAYQSQAGGSVLLLREGTVGADTMFRAAMTENTITTWLLRGGGFLLMLIGLVLVFRPIAVLGSVLPPVGWLLSGGFGLVSLLIALPLSLLTIAVAWFAYRPLFALGLVVVAAGAVGALVRIRRRPAKPVAAAV